MKWRFWSPQNPSQSISCGLAEPLLSLHIDGMTSPSEVRLVESHLSACEDCRRALEWMHATQRVISERCPVLPPVDLKARIAREIAASQPAPLTIRTVRRPIMLRPALLATAVSLIVAGVLFDHTLLTVPSRVVAPPRQTAQLPAPTPDTVPPVATKSPQTRHSAVASRLAVAPPPVTPWRPALRAAPSVTKVAEAAAQSAPDADSLTAAFRAADFRPQVAAVPHKPAQTADGPQEQPHSVPPRIKRVVVAARPPDLVTDAHLDGAVVTPAPETSRLPQAAEVVHPEAPQAAVITPSVTRLARVDVLSSVRPRLAALNADYPRKIARSDVAHVQTTAYNSSGNFPAIIATSYTPGLNDKPEPPRERSGTEQTTPR